MGACRIVYFGDIMGATGRRYLQAQLPSIKQHYQPDFIFANAENATNGFGLTKATAEELHAMGIQGLSLGNHTWDQKSFWGEINSIPYVCRPANLPPTCPGLTYLIFNWNGESIAIINLLGRACINMSLDCPFRTAQHLVESLKTQGVHNILIDFHAETTSEKCAMGWFGSTLRVCAVMGTHTHIQTADERILNDQTAFICDLGMCGASNSILGAKKDPIIDKFINGKPCRYEAADGPAKINGALICIDCTTHKALSIERITLMEAC